MSVNRRTFLGAAGAGLLVLPRERAGRRRASGSGSRSSASRSRGLDHTRLFAKDKGVEVVAVCDVDDAMFAKPIKAVESPPDEGPADREGLSPTARRQVDRRRDDRHARPLAWADDGDGLPGRQGRLCGEAGQP